MQSVYVLMGYFANSTTTTLFLKSGETAFSFWHNKYMTIASG